MNCKSVDDFIINLKDNIDTFVPQESLRQGPLTTYIATNEQDFKQLQQLKHQNYTTFQDIITTDIFQAMNLNEVDIFVLEILLMCDSTYFFAWGTSSVHHYVFKYRYHMKKFSSSNNVQVKGCCV